MYPYTFHVLVGCTPWDYCQLNYEALQVKGEGVGKGNHNDLIVRDVAQFQEKEDNTMLFLAHDNNCSLKKEIKIS